MATTGGRTRLDPETRRIVATGAVTAADAAADAAAVRLAVPAHAAAAVAGLVARVAGVVASSAISTGFAVPGLAVVRAGQLELFGRERFLDLPWRLDECDASAILGMVSEPPDMGQQATVDLSAEGKVKVFMQDLHDQLSLSVGDRGWNYPSLVRWLDRRLAPSTRQRDVTQQSAQRFIRDALQALERDGGFTFERLPRLRFRLVDALTHVVQTYRNERETTAFEACLFGNVLPFKTSADLATVFDPDLCWPNRRYAGRHAFAKHLKPGVIGEMNGEEETVKKKRAPSPSTATRRSSGGCATSSGLPRRFGCKRLPIDSIRTSWRNSPTVGRWWWNTRAGIWRPTPIRRQRSGSGASGRILRQGDACSLW